MTSPVTLNHMRRIRSATIGARAIEGDDLAWIVECIGAYVTGAPDGVTLDDAFDVVVVGGEPWWRKIARVERDDAMRELATCLCPGGSLSDRECAVRSTVRRYMQRWHLVDRHAPEMPGNYAGKPEALLFAVFGAARRMSCDSDVDTDVPTGPTQLRKILSVCPIKGTNIADPPLCERDDDVVSSIQQRRAKQR